MKNDRYQSQADPNPYRPVLVEQAVAPTIARETNIRTRAETIDDCFFTALLGIAAPPVFSVISIFMLLNLPEAQQGEPTHNSRFVLSWMINLSVLAIVLACCVLLFVASSS